MTIDHKLTIFTSIFISRFLSMTEPKVKIHLKAANTHQISKMSTLSVRVSTKCSSFISILQKSIPNLEPNSTIFLYFKQFAIYPDTTVQDIVDHSPGVEEIDINYSISPQFG